MPIAMSSSSNALLQAVAALYRSSGRFPFFYAQGKLRYDPVLLAVLNSGLIKNGMTVLDLGCGQGLLFALLRTAESQYQRGLWPDGWPAPPTGLRLQGIEFRASEVAFARNALGSSATFTASDLSCAELPRADLVILFDVLHYLPAAAQIDLLKRVATALSLGGLLLIREADAGGGLSFRITQFAEWFSAIYRSLSGQRFYFRSRRNWNEILAGHGFGAEDLRMSDGTPFANLLWVARRV